MYNCQIYNKFKRYIIKKSIFMNVEKYLWWPILQNIYLYCEGAKTPDYKAFASSLALL